MKTLKKFVLFIVTVIIGQIPVALFAYVGELEVREILTFNYNHGVVIFHGMWEIATLVIGLYTVGDE